MNSDVPVFDIYSGVGAIFYKKTNILLSRQSDRYSR